ncbi:hypothetical protein [Secundilactobacillus folii]|nr:hypothetical protein [Secundilactobacillus folii]
MMQSFQGNQQRTTLTVFNQTVIAQETVSTPHQVHSLHHRF